MNGRGGMLCAERASFVSIWGGSIRTVSGAGDTLTPGLAVRSHSLLLRSGSRLGDRSKFLFPVHMQ
jgi:hypothetical protein